MYKPFKVGDKVKGIKQEDGSSFYVPSLFRTGKINSVIMLNGIQYVRLEGELYHSNSHWYHQKVLKRVDINESINIVKQAIKQINKEISK